MIDKLITFGCGMFVGIAIGIVVIALAVASRRGDDM